MAILEELRQRLATAQQRHAEVQQRFTKMQQEMQAAQMELNTWNTAVALESREEHSRAVAAAKDQHTLPLIAEQVVISHPDDDHGEHSEPINKTEAIRELLREHPAGITSPDLWKAFQAKVPNTDRAYLYSVLKRLRDREDVMVRRGKYMLKVKPQEVQPDNIVIQ